MPRPRAGQMLRAPRQGYWQEADVENAEIARVLSEIADLLELTGGDAFEVRARRRAAQVVGPAQGR